MTNKILLVGAFPPPVHGMSMVNSFIKKNLIQRGCSLIIINTAIPTLQRQWYIRLLRIEKVFNAIKELITNLSYKSKDTIYLSISGGYGQFYEIMYILIARFFRSKIFLHHHSYAYLNKYSYLTKLLVYLAGQKAVHIILCQDMAEKLKINYSHSIKSLVLSNVVFIAKHDNLKPKQCLQYLGFLSNITEEKGIFEFIELLNKLQEKNIFIKGLIAGNFQNSDIEERVLSKIKSSTNIEYVGAKYDREKLDFFDKIDVLIFPTKYVNEAEPLTIHEAMAKGVPVITIERGCIACLVNEKVGLLINQKEDFITLALDKIIEWQKNPLELQKLSKNALAIFENQYQYYQNQSEKLYQALSNN